MTAPSSDTHVVHRAAVESLKKLWQESAEIDDVRWGYRQAAAVLDVFCPKNLQPFGIEPLESGYPDVDEDTESVSERSVTLKRLLPDIRQEAFERLGSREQMKAALDANAERHQSAMQRMFEAVVDGRSLTLDTLSRDELRALLAARRWLDDVLPPDELPDEGAVASAFARADLLAPWQHLVADGFVDRRSQLTKLREFLWAEERDRPLMLYGIGGVGKSTLLARFALDEIEKSRDRIVFVPIDLDRPNLNPHRPHTFLIEAVEQIERQFQELASKGASVTQHLRELGARYSVSEEGTDLEATRSSERGFDWVQSQMIEVIGSFVSQVLNASDTRALVTIDTFEEAQVEGQEVAGHLVRLLDRLTEANPRIRVVFSGRVRADAPALIEDQLLPGAPFILLEGLDKRSSVSLLRRQLEDVTPTPSRAALREVVAVVGRNPMCIKLAARIIRLEGTKALLEDADRCEMLQRLRDAKIQAFLFGRILDHFQTERIRPLAYPGLIVRRISPDIIREVLAAPCGVELGDGLMAEELYDDLARERTMVEPDGTSGLRYRPDLRRELLPDVLEKVSPEIAADIDRRAVEYYRRFDEPTARAEEIYHLLRLGEDTKVLEARWDPHARDFLKSSAQELPQAGRIWLARKLNIPLDMATRQAASQDDWEYDAALRAERYLKRGDVDRALAAVHERDDRSPGSRLYQLESEALRLQGDVAGALDVASEGLEGATGAARVELLLQLSGILEAEGNLQEASAFSEEALGFADRMDASEDPMLGFRALINRVRLLRKLGRREERDQLRARALRTLDRKMLSELRDYPRLFEETAAELGKHNPALLEAAVRRLGVQARTEEQQEALADALHTVWEEGFEQKVQMPKILDPELVMRIGTSREAAQEVVRQSKGAGLGRFASDLLKAGASSTSSTDRFRDFFRASVEQGLKSSRASVDQGLNVGQWKRKL